MESLGEKLKEARINKGYTLDQIAQETYISKRFVQALEVEDFSVFPGETYLIGFLRNYAEYLGLDSESLITLYKNIKIQEQPLPMDELIHGKRPLPNNYMIIMAIVGAVLLGGGATLFVALNSQAPVSAEEQAAKQRIAEAKARSNGKESYLKEVALTEEFKTGDQITVPYGDDKLFKIEVGLIEKNLVTFLLPDQKQIKMQVDKSEIVELGSGTDSKLKINLNNIFNMGGLNSRINLSLTKLGAQMSPLEEQASSELAANVQPSTSPQTGQSPVPTVSTAASPAPTAQPLVAIANDQTVIVSSEQPKLFVVKAEFNNSCYLRYLIDGKTAKDSFYQKNSNLLIDTALQSVKIWASNGGAVKLKVEGTDLALGRQGQVVTKLIKWVKEGDSRYKLIITSTP